MKTMNGTKQLIHRTKQLHKDTKRRQATHTQMSKPPAFHQAEEEHDAQSYGTADSQDPTHEQFEQEHTFPTSHTMSHQDIYPFSPPRLERQGAAYNIIISPRPGKFEAVIGHQNQEKLRKARGRSTQAQEHERAVASNQPPLQETQSPQTTPPSAATTQKAGSTLDTTTPPAWQVVSASKWKAKASPDKTLHSPSIRKDDNPHTIKKLSNKSATLQQELPAIRNEIPRG
jgi:hypothetical protein